MRSLTLRKLLIVLSGITLAGGASVYLWGILLYHKTMRNASTTIVQMQGADSGLMGEWAILGFLGGCIAVCTVLVIAVSIYLFHKEKIEDELE